MEGGIVEVSGSGDAVLIRLSGEFDASTSAGLLTAVDQLATIDKLCRLEIDAADVSFIDSTGLRLVLDLVVEVRDSGGTISTVNASTRFRRPLELTGLTEIFGLSETFGPGDADEGDPLRP